MRAVSQSKKMGKGKRHIRRSWQAVRR